MFLPKTSFILTIKHALARVWFVVEKRRYIYFRPRVDLFDELIQLMNWYPEVTQDMLVNLVYKKLS